MQYDDGTCRQWFFFIYLLMYYVTICIHILQLCTVYPPYLKLSLLPSSSITARYSHLHTYSWKKITQLRTPWWVFSNLPRKLMYSICVIFLTAPPPCIPLPVQSGHAPEVASGQPQSFHGPLSVKHSIPTPQSNPTPLGGDPSSSSSHQKVIPHFMLYYMVKTWFCW